MVIYGIGNDLIEIDRIQKACEKEAFLLRCYTKEEIALYNGKPQKLAGNFAVKEAVSKALGTGFCGFEPNEISVLRNELGKPYVVLYNHAKKVADEKRIKEIQVTISNTKQFAMATAVAINKD